MRRIKEVKKAFEHCIVSLEMIEACEPEPEPECYDDYGPPVCEACGKKLIGVFCGPCWYKPRGEPDPRTALEKLESEKKMHDSCCPICYPEPPDSEPPDGRSESSAHVCDSRYCCPEPADSEDMERR